MSASNVVYFTTTDASGFYPTALWVSDGTAAGTRLVESFPAGTTIVPLESFLTGFIFAATIAGKTIIYGTLGTALSTRQLASGAFGPLAPDALTTQIAAVNPLLEVTGITRSRGYATVDAVNLATATAVTLLTNLQQSSAAPETVTDFTAVNGEVFFVDGNTAGVSQLYRTDGTVANTGTVWSAHTISNLVAATNSSTGTRLFFAESTTAVPATSHGEVLAITSTAATPTVIADFGAGTAVTDITVAANTVFSVTQNADATYSLWTSDGSNTAAVLVGNLGTAAPAQILVDGDGSARIFFQLGNQVLIATSAGTTVLGTFAAVGTMYVTGGTLYFGANDGTKGMQLWSSDGTQAGTKQLTTIDPTGDFNPSNFSMLNGTLFFSANDGVHGTELWTWNGTTAGLVTDLAPGALGSNPALITPGQATPPGGGSGLVTFTLSNTLDTGSFGVSDGTLGGTAVAFAYAPDVATISNGGLTLSHGSADTTITFASPYGGGAVSTTTLGGFFAARQVDTVTDTSSQVLLFTGYNATSVVLLGTFTPTISGGIAGITDRVGFGSQEYFLVELGNGSGGNNVTQLWSSDGTAANTVQIANLGSVSDPGYSAFSGYSGSSDATASAAGWGALLADDSTNTVSLFTSTGAPGTFNEVTLPSIGVAGSIDNTGYFSLALVGAEYVFSVANAGSIEAVATDGTAVGTSILTSETPASSTQVYGDFTTAGNDVYFDDGVGGALYVTNGTAAGTHMLMSSGAYIAPTAPVQGDATQAGAATTASVTQGGTTYFYFTALQGGQIGLYYADGTSVHQVMASGLAQDAFITESGRNIWFAAENGTSFVTLWETAPGAATATQVVSSAYNKTPYGPPQGVTGIQAGVPLAAPDTFFLTPGNDTVTGGAGDTAIYASLGDLSAGDTIDGGAGINDLYLTGSGTFDLSAPTTLNNVTMVVASGTGDHIQLRNGTTLTLSLLSASGAGYGDVVIGAANADTIIGSGNDTVTVGSNNESISVGHAIITAATEGAFIAAQTVEVAGGGSVTLGSNIDSPTLVTLDVPTNLNAQFSGYFPTIRGSSGADTITLANSVTFTIDYDYVTGGGGADTVIITPNAQNFAEMRDTAADLNGITVQGFDFSPTGATFGGGKADFVDVTDFNYSTAETAVYAAGTLTITNAAGTAQTALAIPGAPAGGGFVLSSDGGTGTLANYIPQIFNLTSEPDSVVGSATNQIDAPNATLSSGDTIDGGVTNIYSTPFTSTLLLQGAGNFNLALPAEITGLSAIEGDTVGGFLGGSGAVNQTITLRNNLNTPVTLGAGHDIVYGAINSVTISSLLENFGASGYIIFVGDARETVQLSGQDEDVIHVTAATGLANISDDLQGSYSATGTEEVDGGGFVPIGGDGYIRTLGLAAPTDMVEYGTVPNLIVGSTGHDTIDVTNAGAGGFGNLVTVEPNGGGDVVVAPINDAMLLLGTQAQLNDTTIDGFNFLPTQPVGFASLTTSTVIDISDLAYSAGVVTANFSGGTLSVLNAGSLVDTFVVPLPGAGSFTAAKDAAGTGTDLSFTATGSLVPENVTLAAGPTVFVGSPSNDTLTIPAGVLGPGQTLDGQGGDNVLALSGSGSFDLTQPAVLQNFSVLELGSNETVTLRSGLPMQLALFDGGSNTLIGADTPDVIDAGGNAVIVGNPGATVVGAATITVTAATIGATIYGEAAYGASTTLDVSGGGGMSMGNNIYDVDVVSLTQTGAQFYANNLPGLALTISGTSTAPGALPDVVVAGGGGDTITDSSLGGNILAGGAGDDVFAFDQYISPSFTYEFPTDDSIYNFDVSGSDIIRVETDTTTISYNSGTLHVGGISPSQGIDIVLNGTYDGTFTPTLNPAAFGTDITFSGTITGSMAAPCFAADTRILTTVGEVAVEALRVGDRVPTLLGQRAAPVVWLGHRRVDVRHHKRPLDVQPVRVQAEAFGPGLPHRDLVLSPDHALFVDGTLVPVRMLVNGTSIARLNADTVTYWHVELDRHDVLLAEGLPTESFLDAGNRDAFDGGTVDLLAHFPAAYHESQTCAPLALLGPAVAAARSMLMWK